MSRACCGGAGGAIRRSATSFGITDALAFAASPTFAVMAVVTSTLGGDRAETLCSAVHASPLSGMATMYLLMSVFHAAPWVRVVRGRLS